VVIHHELAGPDRPSAKIRCGKCPGRSANIQISWTQDWKVVRRSGRKPPRVYSMRSGSQEPAQGNRALKIFRHSSHRHVAIEPSYSRLSGMILPSMPAAQIHVSGPQPFEIPGVCNAGHIWLWRIQAHRTPTSSIPRAGAPAAITVQRASTRLFCSCSPLNLAPSVTRLLRRTGNTSTRFARCGFQRGRSEDGPDIQEPFVGG